MNNVEEIQGILEREWAAWQQAPPRAITDTLYEMYVIQTHLNPFRIRRMTLWERIKALLK